MTKSASARDDSNARKRGDGVTGSASAPAAVADDAGWTDTICLDRRTSEPLYRQLVQRIREAVLTGRLRPGARLPSTRSLATELNAARGTVELAYELLLSEGFIETRGAAGTRVNTQLAPQHHETTVEAAGEAMVRDAGPLPVAPLQMGLPALDLFPRKLWTRVAGHEGRRLPTDAFSYGDAQGQWRLRRAIASYLAISRGIECDAARVIVTTGYHGALGLLMMALLHDGSSCHVWFEDPGYRRARDALRLAGAQLIGVPVDDEGIDVAAGIARAPHAGIAVVTPSHQAPLGVSLSLPRRLALLDWAARAGAWIIEDDYDGEFRYAGRPLPALASLDEQERVLYVGSFSKALAPGLRLGYVVAPPALLERLARVAALLAPPPALTLQDSIAAFIEAGHFSRHIRRMRAAYALRRDTLADALRRHVGGVLDVGASAGGMHLIGWLREDFVSSATETRSSRSSGPTRASRALNAAQSSATADTRRASGTLSRDVLLAHAAERLGLAPEPLSTWYVDAPPREALLMSFTNVPPEGAEDVARRLADAFARPYA